MKSEFREPEYWAYEKRPWYLRQRLLREGSDHAEWGVPDGYIGGLVRQLRYRAHVAANRGRWLFLLLFLVIVFGLSYYVGLPIWQQLQDGTKRGLEAEVSLIDSQLAQMDLDRNASWGQLKDSVYRSVRTISSERLGAEASAVLSVKNQTRLVSIRQDGIAQYTDDAGITWRESPLPSPPNGFQDTPFVLRKSVNDNQLLATQGYRLDGSGAIRGLGRFSSFIFPMWYSSDQGETWERSVFPPNTPLGKPPTYTLREDPFSLLIYEDLAIRTLNFGKSWDLVDIGTPLDQVSETGYTDDAWYIVVEGPEVWFSTNKGENWKSLNLPDVAGGSNLSIVRADQNFSRVEIELRETSERGSRLVGELFTLDNGTTWLNLNGDEEAISYGEVVILDVEDSFTVELEMGAFEVNFLDAYVQVAKRGEEEQIVARFIGESTYSDRQFWKYDSQNFLFSMSGPADQLRFVGTADGGRTWRVYPSGVSPPITGFSEIVSSAYNPEFLVYYEIRDGPGSGISAAARLDSFHYQALNSVDLGSGSSGDRLLRQAVAELPETLLRDPLFAGGYAEIQRIIRDRTTLERNLAAKRTEANQIGGSGVSYLQRQRDFHNFMDVCEGSQADCLEAFSRIRAEDELPMWRFIAERAPPAILLLFLLVTLGGLYRYNLRLTGFHHSRADALVLLHTLLSEKSPPSKDDLIAFANLADQIAADKVDFGKSSSPTDQVFELARALTQRS